MTLRAVVFGISIAVLSVTLGACRHVGELEVGADGGADGGADAGAVSLDGPCAPETLVGSFEVGSYDLGDSQSAVIYGLVADSVNWITTPVLRADAGACKAWEYSTWDCGPQDCADGGQICDDEGECVPFPTHLDVGTIHVSGLVTDVSMEPSSAFTYGYDNIDNPPFAPGAPITLSAEGGAGTGAFSLHGVGVTPLTVESRNYVMHDNEDMVVTWNPSEDAEGEIHGEFMIDPEGDTRMWIYCTWDDTGSGVVPAGLIHELFLEPGAGSYPGSGTSRLYRRTVDSLDLPWGCAELRVLSEIDLDLEYEYPTE
jgi:hypothetical protein